MFSIKAIKSDRAEIKIKGFFLSKPILISSVIDFYFGFVLPDWLKRLLIKD